MKIKIPINISHHIWKIAFLIALSLLSSSVLNAEETPLLGPQLSIDDQIHVIWAKKKDSMKSGFQKSVANGDVYALYNIEIATNNLLTYAGRRKDTDILDDIAQLYLVAFPYLKDDKRGHLVWIYTSSTTRVAKENPKLLGGEVMLCSVQFLYAVSSLIDFVARVSPENRKPAMKEAVEKFASVIIRDHYLRWIVSWEPMIKRKLNMGVKLKNYDNKVTDKETFLVAGVVKMLSANHIDAKAVPLSVAEKKTFLDFAVLGSKLLQSHLSPSQLKDFNGNPVIGLNFDSGFWDACPGNAYAGYIGDKFPEPADKKAAVSLGWDISHARRFVDVFDTLYDNRDITHQSFPDETIMKGLANQVAYGVFNGDFKHPLFTNYMNGANGWYRVGYQGRINFGYGPYGLSTAIPEGGYGFWNRFNPDIGKILAAFWQWAQEAKATNAPDFLKFYSKGYFNKDGASLELLEFLPTIADYKNN
jgi:hypothetical protein